VDAANKEKYDDSYANKEKEKLRPHVKNENNDCSNFARVGFWRGLRRFATY